VVHVFSERAREFYDLERLWKTAKRLEPADLEPARPKGDSAGAPTPAAKAPTKRARRAPAKPKDV
jgi:ribosome-associated protein